eukprot:CAMPEP_0184686732 /NCGR_PEP_ID=MMETSP0312-20130426/23791_2 /TAXON_ID=31354 /ORGANISM="Compsopogon coeruleus, Strain SAG 36.94" /LENGTH=170 /DNA_ID=CAMNT_0027142157 /DNA_START=279 /DNA_END=791 /DNA_ORIENTATION=-
MLLVLRDHCSKRERSEGEDECIRGLMVAMTEIAVGLDKGNAGGTCLASGNWMQGKRTFEHKVMREVVGFAPCKIKSLNFSALGGTSAHSSMLNEGWVVTFEPNEKGREMNEVSDPQGARLGYLLGPFNTIQLSSMSLSAITVCNCNLDRREVHYSLTKMDDGIQKRPIVF